MLEQKIVLPFVKLKNDVKPSYAVGQPQQLVIEKTLLTLAYFKIVF